MGRFAKAKVTHMQVEKGSKLGKLTSNSTNALQSIMKKTKVDRVVEFRYFD